MSRRLEDSITAADLDDRTVRWFLGYIKALKQRANQQGRISLAAEFGHVVDDIEWNISRGSPSTLVKLPEDRPRGSR